MKQVAGQFAGSRELAEVKKQMPDVLKAKKLTPYQGLLHAIWTDERIASVCVSMRNTDQIPASIPRPARVFEPLKAVEIRQLRDAAPAGRTNPHLAHAPAAPLLWCTKMRLGDITFYLTYHDHHGYRSEAVENFARLESHERDWADADLEAAREACPNRLDFAKLLPLRLIVSWADRNLHSRTLKTTASPTRRPLLARRNLFIIFTSACHRRARIVISEH